MSEHESLPPLPDDLRALLDVAREPSPLAPDDVARRLRALDARVIAEAALPPEGASPSSLRAPWWRRAGHGALGFVLGVLVGAGVYHRVRPTPPPRVVVRERVVAPSLPETTQRSRRAVPVPSPVFVPAPAPVSVPVSVPVSSPVPPPVSRRRRHVTREGTDDLGAERALLDRARIALRSGETDAALSALDAHRRRFPAGQLAPDRGLLHVRTLVAAGRRAEAQQAAERFRREHPRHALSSAVEAALR